MVFRINRIWKMSTYHHNILWTKYKFIILLHLYTDWHCRFLKKILIYAVHTHTLQIQIDAAKVFFKGLKTIKTSPNHASSSPSSSSSFFSENSAGTTMDDAVDNGDHINMASGHRNSVGRSLTDNGAAKKRSVEDVLPSVYQLCVCGNGKVFMSPPDGQCAADNESLVCR